MRLFSIVLLLFTLSLIKSESPIYPDRLSVAIDDVYDANCLRNMDTFLDCPLASIQTASFLINLLRNTDTNTSLTVYNTDDFYSIFSEMTSPDNDRKVDLYPFALAVTDEEPWVYEYTGATEWMPYFMYANTRALSTSLRQSPTRFLISPFRWTTWIAFSLSVGAVSFLNLIVSRIGGTGLSAAFNRLSWFAVFFLFVVYTSNLKALLAQPKPLDPFVNLKDLADQMAKGKRRIVLEEEHTRRWRILVDRNLTKPMQFMQINRVIHAKPGALVIANNQSEICRMLEIETDLVFFAYHDLVQTLCGELCLWQYRVTEYPVIMTALPIVNMTGLSSKMDVFLLAAFSYKEMLLNRLYKPRCGPMSTSVNVIGIESLYGAIIIWATGLCFSAAVLIVEITKKPSSRTAHMIETEARMYPEKILTKLEEHRSD